jgi:hypothetical protein
MAIYALISAGGSPGVTTSALALALTWPRPVIVAECDPSGGDVLAGLFAGHLQAGRGLLNVAFEAGRGLAAIATELGSQLLALDDSDTRGLLAGIGDPRQALGLAPIWPAIAGGLASLDADVIADCGRFDAGPTQPLSVLAEARVVVMVMMPTLRQVAAAGPRIDMASQLVAGRDRLAVLLVGSGALRPIDIAKSLGVGIVGSLPEDLATARLLSDGEGPRAKVEHKPLLRSAKVAGRAISELAPTPLGTPELTVGKSMSAE